MHEQRPMKRLPSLDSLRAFEVAARHLSFTKAAEELHVTQSALSHRISALAEELGLRLFNRLTRKMTLTAEGEALADGIRRGIDEIRQALAAIGPATSRGPITVSVLPSFAARWLVPRLPRFRASHPEVDVRITADASVVNLRASGVDVAIRFGRGRYPGHEALHLMADVVLPVCSPQLLEKHGPLSAPEHVLRLPMLYDVAAESDGSGADWASWLRYVGRPDAVCEDGLRFNQALLALEAAASGLGVALARRSLVEGDLASGRLVAPLPQAAPTIFSYYLVYLPEAAKRPSLVAFRDWICTEARAGTAQGKMPEQMPG